MIMFEKIKKILNKQFFMKYNFKKYFIGMLDNKMNFAQASVEDILYYLPNDDILKSISHIYFQTMVYFVNSRTNIYIVGLLIIHF